MRPRSIVLKPWAALGCLVLTVTVGAVLVPGSSDAMQKGASNRAPKLYEPHETVVLPEDGGTVRFRWDANAMRGDAHLHDEFRIFKGNQAYADAMIHDEKVPAGRASAEVPASVFEGPGVYCWTVRQVGARDKSRKAFSVFKINGR